MGIVIAILGAVAAAAGLFDWEWFMNHRKARRLTSWIGRGPARAVYVSLGVVAIVTGILITTGTVSLQ